MRSPRPGPPRRPRAGHNRSHDGIEHDRARGGAALGPHARGRRHDRHPRAGLARRAAPGPGPARPGMAGRRQPHGGLQRRRHGPEPVLARPTGHRRAPRHARGPLPRRPDHRRHEQTHSHRGGSRARRRGPREGRRGPLHGRRPRRSPRSRAGPLRPRAPRRAFCTRKCSSNRHSRVQNAHLGEETDRSRSARTTAAAPPAPRRLFRGWS